MSPDLSPNDPFRGGGSPLRYCTVTRGRAVTVVAPGRIVGVAEVRGRAETPPPPVDPVEFLFSSSVDRPMETGTPRVGRRASVE